MSSHASCVVLHNMCEVFGDNCPLEWADSTPPLTLSTSTFAPRGTDTASACIHDAIMQHL